MLLGRTRLYSRRRFIKFPFFTRHFPLNAQLRPIETLIWHNVCGGLGTIRQREMYRYCRGPDRRKTEQAVDNRRQTATDFLFNVEISHTAAKPRSQPDWPIRSRTAIEPVELVEHDLSGFARIYQDLPGFTRIQQDLTGCNRM